MEEERRPVAGGSGTWPACYSIKVRETLSTEWSAWFEGLEITHEADGSTTISGPVRDDAALYGLINKARDLGLGLLALTRQDPDSQSATLQGSQ